MVDGILTPSVLQDPMLIVDFKTPSPLFYNFPKDITWSKDPDTKILKQGGKIF